MLERSDSPFIELAPCGFHHVTTADKEGNLCRGLNQMSKTAVPSFLIEFSYLPSTSLTKAGIDATWVTT
jgi:hypothetical protein